MNQCTSLESLKEYLLGIFSRDDVLSKSRFDEIQQYLNPLEPCEDYELAFLHAVYYVLVEDGANFILLLRYVESIVLKNGILFHRVNVEISKDIAISDLTFIFLLFLLEQSRVESQSVCCTSLLREFFRCGFYADLHSFSLSIFSAYCLSSFQADFVCNDFYQFAAELFSFSCDLPQYCCWNTLEEMIQFGIHNFGSQKPWMFINSLLQVGITSDRLKEYVFAHVLLPLVEKPSSIKKISNCSHILNTLRLLIQNIYTVIPREQFLLWLECIQYSHSLISSEEVDSLLLMLLYAIQSYSLSIHQINHCLSACSHLLSLSQFTVTCLIHVICSLLLNEPYRTNRTILKRSLSLLLTLPAIPNDCQSFMTQSVLYIDSFLIQSDINHGLSYSTKSVRALCLQLLFSLPISFHDVIHWFAIPLYVHQSNGFPWLAEEDVQQILRYSLSQASSLIVSQDRLVMDVVYRILATFACPSSMLDEESKFFYDIVFSPSRDAISSLLNSCHLPYACKHLLENKETWIEPHLLDCLHQDCVYRMNGNGSDTLNLAASFSYTRLQELLIESSCQIQSDHDLLVVLKLLYAVNHSTFSKYHQLATEKEQNLERELIVGI